MTCVQNERETEHEKEEERARMPPPPLLHSITSSSAAAAAAAAAATYGARYRHYLHCVPSSMKQVLLSSTIAALRRPVPAISSSSCRPSSGSITVRSLFSDMERFWGGSSIENNKDMLELLRRYGVIRSNKVAETMEKIDRALFVPEGSPAYMDNPLPIGYNATISAPHMHATCLQLLEENLQPGMRALDVGSGTGYLTACFALMVGLQGRAVGVEHIPELVASSIQNIQKSEAAPLLKEGVLSMHVGDGRLGWPELAPYDAIHVGAAAPEIPKALIEQLKPGGRMIIPVGNIFQDLKVVDKDLDGSIRIRDETSVRYVPLTSRDAQLQDF